MQDRIVEIVRHAGNIILSARNIGTTVEEKTSHRDLVTKYDREVQSYLRQALLTLLPEAEFMGEEDDQVRNWASAELLFIVDPIDGTTNFVQGFHNSCVSVGLMRRGRMELGVVYNPYDGELYCAQRSKGAYLNGRRLQAPDKELSHSLLIFGSAAYYGDLTEQTLGIFNAAFSQVQDIRRFGSAALDFCYIAAGKAGVFYECRLCPWDYAAGSLIAEEAGARVSTLDGKPLDYFHKCSVLAGTPTAYDQLLHIAAPFCAANTGGSHVEG